MAEICNECPMRHTIKGETVGLLSVEEVTFTRSRDGFKTRIGKVGVLADLEGNSSLPLRLPDLEGEDRTIDFISERIDDCGGPEVETRGLLRRKFVTGCPALGALGINEPRFNDAILEEIGPQLLKLSHDAKKILKDSESDS